MPPDNPFNWNFFFTSQLCVLSQHEGQAVLGFLRSRSFPFLTWTILVDGSVHKNFMGYRMESFHSHQLYLQLQILEDLLIKYVSKVGKHHKQQSLTESYPQKNNNNLLKGHETVKAQITSQTFHRFNNPSQFLNELRSCHPILLQSLEHFKYFP